MSKWNSASQNNQKNDILIRQGELISGVIDRAAIGSEEPDSILHRIAKDYGSEDVRSFLNSVLSVLRAYITNIGFSFSFEELVLDASAEKKVMKNIDDSYNKVSDLINQYEDNTLPLTKGLQPQEALEAYKLVTKFEDLNPSLEPSHAFAEAIKIAPKLSKDTIIICDSCGDAHKDRDILRQRLGN